MAVSYSNSSPVQGPGPVGSPGQSGMIMVSGSGGGGGGASSSLCATYDSCISGNVLVSGSTSFSHGYSQNNLVLGDSDTDKTKLYIVETWQSRNPIKINEGLWVSLENDIIPNDEIKTYILDKLIETNPEILIKLGLNADNVKLVKTEVTLEINKD